MNNFSLKAMPFDSQVITNPNTGQKEYDRVAHSKDLADTIRAYFSNGILVRGSDLLTNELQVLHLSAMSCVVKPGGIIINGRTGFLENEETLEFDVGTQNPRIDRVVAELNIAERNIYIKVLKGVAEVDPKPTAIMQTEDIYQIPLAKVRINANQAVISSVTDERAGYISNVLLNQAPRTDVQAEEIKISEVVKKLYGLTEDNGNVDKALQKIMNMTKTNVEIISESKIWNKPPGVKEIDEIILVGGGAGGNPSGNYSSGGSGGGSGYINIINNFNLIRDNYSVVIGSGGTSGSDGGNTSFDNFIAYGGKKGSGNTGGSGFFGGGGSGGGGVNGKYTGNGVGGNGAYFNIDSTNGTSGNSAGNGAGGAAGISQCLIGTRAASLIAGNYFLLGGGGGAGSGQHYYAEENSITTGGTGNGGGGNGGGPTQNGYDANPSYIGAGGGGSGGSYGLKGGAGTAGICVLVYRKNDFDMLL